MLTTKYRNTMKPSSSKNPIFRSQPYVKQKLIALFTSTSHQYTVQQTCSSGLICLIEQFLVSFISADDIETEGDSKELFVYFYYEYKRVLYAYTDDVLDLEYFYSLLPLEC